MMESHTLSSGPPGLAVSKPPDQELLAELGGIASREYALAVKAAQSTLEHAIKAGEALNRAKAICPRDEWHKWVRQIWPGSTSQAQTFMRLARHQDRIPRDVNGIYNAQAALRGLPAADGTRRGGQQPGSAKRARKIQAALKHIEREKAALARGGTVADCYSAIRKVTQQLEKARSQEEDEALRRALDIALARVHEAEDCIVWAVGIA